MCPVDRFTSGPRRPFCLKPWLELMCREKSLPCSPARPHRLLGSLARISTVEGQVAGSRAKLLGLIFSLPAS